MTVDIKQVEGGTARITSRGVEAIMVYRAKETGGSILDSVDDPISLYNAISTSTPTGDALPAFGVEKDFTLPDGTIIGIPLQQIQIRKIACDYIRIQCWFSSFSYWSGPGNVNPISPDPRVVFLNTGRQQVDEVPVFIKRFISVAGGLGGAIPVWPEMRRIPIVVNTGSLSIRVYLAGGMTESGAQAIYSRIGQIHTISGEKWRFMGAQISETAGGLVSQDPVFVTYRWEGENESGGLFADDENTATIPDRPAFHRYTWVRNSNPTLAPIISTYLPTENGLDPELIDQPNGFIGLPGEPILTGGTPNNG